MNHQQIHPVLAQRLLAGEKSRELYKLIILAKIYPDDDDLSTQALAQFTTHTWAVDADDARRQLDQHWAATMPEGAELLYVLANAPAPGGIEEDSMMSAVKLGPRVIEG